MTGAVSYHAGRAAEDIVARRYMAQGDSVRAQRWRGTGGEIDLIVQSGDTLVFVEVKKSRSRDRAVQLLSQRQLARICAAAEEFCGGEPAQRDTPMRVDLAVVGGTGEVEVIEDILC